MPRISLSAQCYDLCVSGDLGYKPYVTSEPDVTAVALDGTEDFLVLACDGLWDFVAEEVAVMAVYEQISEAPGRDIFFLIKVIWWTDLFILHRILKLQGHLMHSLMPFEVVCCTLVTILWPC